MDFEYKIYIQRAQNEINLSKMILTISENEDIQINIFNIPFDTYYSAVISHSYYSVFYMAKAYLLKKGIKTQAPEEHKKTYDEFKEFVDLNIVDFELLKLYEDIMIKANQLLKIFNSEKNKRGKFTYKTLPQANKDPAKESINNAEIFFKYMNNLCI